MVDTSNYCPKLQTQLFPHNFYQFLQLFNSNNISTCRLRYLSACVETPPPRAPQYKFVDVIFEHRSGCCATEPGYVEDIDWFSCMPTAASGHRHGKTCCMKRSKLPYPYPDAVRVSVYLCASEHALIIIGSNFHRIRTRTRIRVLWT